MKSIALSFILLITSCATKKTISTMDDSDILVIGRAINLHQGEVHPISVLYRTDDKSTWGLPRAENYPGNYFTAIIKKSSDKFAVKEIRMQGEGFELSWGKEIKNALAETLIDPDAKSIYVGDIILRTRNLEQSEEVTDFKIMDRSAEAKLFAIQTLKINSPITKSLMKIKLK